MGMKNLNIICLFLVVGVLCACGIKPKNVDAPNGAAKNTFPATYPNPNTEPQ